jgi:hypothetical protein
MSPSWNVVTSLHDASDHAFVQPWHPLSACNLDTVTAAAWNRGSFPIEFLFQCVHLAACCCSFAFYYCFMFVWWHSSSCFSPTWCSLINFPAIRLLRRPGYTTHCEPPIAKVVKCYSKPGQVSSYFVASSFFFFSFLSSFFLYLYVCFIYLPISFYEFVPLTFSFHFLFCHFSFIQSVTF